MKKIRKLPTHRKEEGRECWAEWNGEVRVKLHELELRIGSVADQIPLNPPRGSTVYSLHRLSSYCLSTLSTIDMVLIIFILLDQFVCVCICSNFI